MHRDMFKDADHILRVSLDLEFATPKDIANLQISSLVGNQMLARRNKLYVSAAEWKEIDIGLPVDFLNLNEGEVDGEKRCLIKLKAARNKFGIKAVHVSIVKPEEQFIGVLAVMMLNES